MILQSSIKYDKVVFQKSLFLFKKRGGLNLKNNIALETIYNNLHLLIKDFKDLPETEEAENNFRKFVKQNMLAESESAMEDALYCVCDSNQKQGFIYGFKYAVELLAK